jgi:hypothetical protein
MTHLPRVKTFRNTIKMKQEYKNVCFRHQVNEFPQQFGIVTAYNPEGVTLNSLKNKDADERLRADIDSRALKCFRITGMSKDEVHQEPGWGIRCSKETVIQLGRTYKQDAIFWISNDLLFLIDLEELNEEPLGNFSSFLYNPLL